MKRHLLILVALAALTGCFSDHYIRANTMGLTPENARLAEAHRVNLQSQFDGNHMWWPEYQRKSDLADVLQQQQRYYEERLLKAQTQKALGN